MTIFSDRELSRQIERAEARSNADFVDSHARLVPESGAEWAEIGGIYAMFDGAESPSTQTFGLGLFGEVSADRLQEVETFFKHRGGPVLHEVSPMADAAILPLLNRRGYRPIELTSVMYQALDTAERRQPPRGAGITTRIIDHHEVDLWARTSAAGWVSEMPDFSDGLLQYCRIVAQSAGSTPFLAESAGGRPIATGSLYVHDGVALLAGASTVPEGRRQGAQGALLEARLTHAARQGCRVAIMGALPGSQSQRNAEKNGFRIAYTRTKWQLSG